ncbi:winged helix-turn-helix transcriptional regulator [Merismopedia glauca]|uniref:Transcriptional regulator n=1 Tax=Merismopedia glauca CCAP 1448/3 TaxID=1296344 RepID=A0A2T1C5M0_9CYAN|nr:winged helix-turn-helix transcriptional regulator [Merismopedia glauca]PSB03448.1 hypothetical protein C7B64_08540 [Merismopedia glauca CCAP 1448/3]
MPEHTYLCPIEVTIALIGGKWKCVILWWLRRDAKSFGELKQLVSGITPKVLTQQLRELEEVGLVSREAYPETPRRVEYSLTPYGETLTPITELMCEWGKNHLTGFESGVLNLGGLRVLIVSKLDLGKSLRSPLDIRHAQVAIATSVSEAMVQFQQQQPDILIIDTAMDNNEGFGVIERIRALESHSDRQLPAIALTKADNLERRQALRAGFSVHLTKPVEFGELVAAIASLTSKLAM